MSMLTTKTQLEPEPYWVPICNAYSLLHHRIANTLSKFTLCIPQENAPSPFGIVIKDVNSNEMIVNYNGNVMLMIKSKIDIYNSTMKHTVQTASKLWQL